MGFQDISLKLVTALIKRGKYCPNKFAIYLPDNAKVTNKLGGLQFKLTFRKGTHVL